MQSIAMGLGLPMGLEVETDSSAARAIAMREGVGKVKHLQTIYLWLHDLHAREELEVTKIAGTRNAADLLTKHLEEEKVLCLLYTSPSPRDRTRSRMPSSA